jgi:hypothetical protein
MLNWTLIRSESIALINPEDSHKGFQNVSHVKEHCTQKASLLFDLDCSAYRYIANTFTIHNND